jgi:hypothetical protein
MKDSNVAVDKLQRIQQLWGELGRTKSDAPEYDSHLTNIRSLSTEYHALMNSVKNPEKLKKRSA